MWALFLIFLDALVQTMAAIVANQHLHLLYVVRVELPEKVMLNLMACLRSHAANLIPPQVCEKGNLEITLEF